MKFYAINGSPRKNGNTAAMLQHFLDGAASAGQLETEMVHLYDRDYKGCISCFRCQRDNDATYARCQYRDGISDLLPEVSMADGVALGSPIYIHDLTSGLRAFLERLAYPYVDFRNKGNTNAPKKLPVAMIYTMNVMESQMREAGYETILKKNEDFIARIFRAQPVRICAYNTYQYADYSQYRVGLWDERAKAEHRRVQFPLDCQAAYDAGKKMAADCLAEKA